jgi:hypothetical protein
MRSESLRSVEQEWSAPKSSANLRVITQEILPHTMATWSCTHFGNQSEIESYIAATGKWETVADVRPVAGVDAEDMADFIVNAVKHYHLFLASKEPTRGHARD